MPKLNTKLPLSPAQELWLVEQWGLPSRHNNPNPCVRLYGFGPVGAKCKGCQLLYRHGRFFKCQLRNFTRGPGSDHRANWKACGRFVAVVATPTPPAPIRESVATTQTSPAQAVSL